MAVSIAAVAVDQSGVIAILVQPSPHGVALASHQMWQ